MPTYEYACRACGHIFEIVQKMSDDPLVICPECGGVLRKVFAPPAISFKGSGFYATDHGKSAKPSGESGSPKGDKPKEGGASKESKGDTTGEGSSSSPAPAPAPAKKQDSSS